MINLINWLFKKQERVYNISDQLCSDKKIISYGDLYEKLGVTSDIKQMVEESEFKKYHYSNIQANKKTIEKIDNLIRYNLCETKNKYSRMYKKNYLMTMAAFDSLAWAPKCNDNVKDDCVVVILPKSLKFRKVTKKDI